MRLSDIEMALDGLLNSAQIHLAEAAYASHALPFEIFLLAMLLEEHKAVMRIRLQIDDLATNKLQEKGVNN